MGLPTRVREGLTRLLHPDAPFSTPGAEVSLRDGSLWFHPYTGQAPVLLRPAWRP